MVNKVALDRLAPIAEEVDNDSPDKQAEQKEEAVQLDQAESDALAWAVIPTSIGRMACMLVPELKPLYSDEACLEWGRDMVPVAAKYGLGGPSALPEVALIISTAGFAVPTWLAIRAKIAALKAASSRPAADDQIPTPEVTEAGS